MAPIVDVKRGSRSRARPEVSLISICVGVADQYFGVVSTGVSTGASTGASTGVSTAVLQCAAAVTSERMSSTDVASTCAANVLLDDAPSAPPCPAPTPSQIDPSALVCAGLDDLSVALGGLGVGTSWLTRIESTTAILAAAAAPHVVDAEAGPVPQFHVVTQSASTCAVGSAGNPGAPTAVDAGTSASTTNDTTDTAAAAIADGCASGASDSCDSSSASSGASNESSGCDGGSSSGGDSSASSGCGGGSGDSSSCSTRAHRRTRASPVGYLLVLFVTLARRARRPRASRLDLVPQ